MFIEGKNSSPACCPWKKLFRACLGLGWGRVGNPLLKQLFPRADTTHLVISQASPSWRRHSCLSFFTEKACFTSWSLFSLTHLSLAEEQRTCVLQSYSGLYWENLCSQEHTMSQYEQTRLVFFSPKRGRGSSMGQITTAVRRRWLWDEQICPLEEPAPLLMVCAGAKPDCEQRKNMVWFFFLCFFF